jgi:hypothetical protein
MRQAPEWRGRRRAGGGEHAHRRQVEARKILEAVEVEVGVAGVLEHDVVGEAEDAEGVAVRLGPGHLGNADFAAGALAVDDVDGLAELLAEPVGDDARDRVAAAAGAVGHDEGDGLGRVVLRGGDGACGDERRREQDGDGVSHRGSVSHGVPPVDAFGVVVGAPRQKSAPEGAGSGAAG